MDTTELLALFRTEVVDATAPFLWSDELIYGYIDAAQKQFCRDSYGIADARTFTVAVLADGTEWYTLNERVLKLRSATDSATGRPVPLVAAENMAGLGMYFDGARGPVRALVTGLEENVVRAWPKPNAAATVNLDTFRLPATVVSGSALTVASHHQRYLLHWVKHLAYDVQDSETYDKNASDKYRARHDAYCAKALLEQSRGMHTAGAVAYGGI